jgi:hypothetical protein
MLMYKKDWVRNNESLTKTATTHDNGNLEVEYFYNEYDHLIKTVTTYVGKPQKSIVEYDIEYY